MPAMHSFGDIEKGLVISVMLSGAAIGAFLFPYIAYKYGVKKIALFTVALSIILWLAFYLISSHSLLLLISFLFGVFIEASWPIALHSQEIEPGVTKENEGIASSLYISISNVGGAILPVLIGYIEKSIKLAFIGIMIYLILCLSLWVIIKKNKK